MTETGDARKNDEKQGVIIRVKGNSIEERPGKKIFVKKKKILRLELFRTPSKDGAAAHSYIPVVLLRLSG